MRLKVHVQPGASRSEVAGRHGDAIKVRLTAPPVDGRANEALLGFLAECLGLPVHAVTLVRGASSRAKTVDIEGMDAETVAHRLLDTVERT